MINRLAKNYRDDAALLTHAEIGCITPLNQATKWTVRPVFYLRTHSAVRLSDGDNLNASLKHGLDGIARGMGVNDRMFRVMPPIVKCDRNNPRVEITVEGEGS